MKNFKTRFICLFAMTLAVTALLVAPSSSAMGQNRNPAPLVPGSPKPGDELRPASIRERQYRMMELEREAGRRLSPEEQKLALAQIAEDYKQIQVINNKMMGATMRPIAPDYINISQTLAEIRNRAIRLKSNLGLGHLEVKDLGKAKHTQALGPADLKADLLALDNMIMRFIKNEIFKTPEVVNLEEAAQARRHVELIIEKSQLIQKDAERLRKSSLN